MNRHENQLVIQVWKFEGKIFFETNTYILYHQSIFKYWNQRVGEILTDQNWQGMTESVVKAKGTSVAGGSIESGLPLSFSLKWGKGKHAI